jgi:hypothetical protein
MATNAQLSVLLSQYRFRLAEVMKELNNFYNVQSPAYSLDWKLPYNQPDGYKWNTKLEPFTVVHDEFIGALQELTDENTGGMQSGVIGNVTLAAVLSNYLAMLNKIDANEDYIVGLHSIPEWELLLNNLALLIDQL